MELTSRIIELVSAVIVLGTAIRGAIVVNRNKSLGRAGANVWSDVVLPLALPFVAMLGFPVFIYAFIWINKQLVNLGDHPRQPVHSEVAADSLSNGDDTTAHRVKLMLRSAMGVESPGDRDDLLARIAADASSRGAHRLAIEAASRIDGPGKHDQVLSDLTKMDLRVGDFEAASAAAGLIEQPGDRDKAETSVVNTIDSIVRTGR